MLRDSGPSQSSRRLSRRESPPTGRARVSGSVEDPKIVGPGEDEVVGALEAGQRLLVVEGLQRSGGRQRDLRPAAGTWVGPEDADRQAVVADQQPGEVEQRPVAVVDRLRQPVGGQPLERGTAGAVQEVPGIRRPLETAADVLGRGLVEPVLKGGEDRLDDRLEETDGVLVADHAHSMPPEFTSAGSARRVLSRS